MTEQTHRVLINAPTGGGFTVSVDPVPDGDDFAKGFPTHREARGWAGGIRLTRGWPIVDLTTGGAK